MECRLTTGISCRQKRPGLCSSSCKGQDAFDCQLHAFVRRNRARLDEPKLDYLFSTCCVAMGYHLSSACLIYGALIPKSLQIFRHKTSLISACLGTADRRPFAGFPHQEWLPPSRTSSHPFLRRWARNARRFTPESGFPRTRVPRTGAPRFDSSPALKVFHKLVSRLALAIYARDFLEPTHPPSAVLLYDCGVFVLHASILPLSFECRLTTGISCRQKGPGPCSSLLQGTGRFRPVSFIPLLGGTARIIPTPFRDTCEAPIAAPQRDPCGTQ